MIKRIVLFILAPILLVLFPVLFLGKTFANSDFLYLHLPHLDFYREALLSGQSFLWNPFIVSGFPAFASLVGGLLSPLNLVLFRFLPVLDAHALAIFINLLLAGLFTALFLRELKFSGWAQIFGALTFVFSQWFIVPDLGIVNSFPILPLLFFLLYKSQNRLWPVFAGGPALGWLLLAGHFNWILMILTAGFFFALYLGRRVFLKYIFMLAMGGIIGFVQLFPAYIYSQFSARALVPLSFTEASVGAVSLWDLPKLLLPYFRLPLVENAEALLYIGVLPLFFMVLAFGVRHKDLIFFKALLAGALLMSIKYSPLFWLTHQLPVFADFRGPSRWLFVGFFAASVLAAAGFDYFNETQNWKTIWTRIYTWAGGLTMFASVLLSLVLSLFHGQILDFLKTYFVSNLYQKTAGLPLAHYERVIDNMLGQVREIFNLASPAVLFSLLFIFLGVLAVNLFVRNKQALVILTALNFILVFFFFHPVLDRKVLAETPETARAIGQGEGKVLAFLPGFSEWDKLTVPYGFDAEESFRFNSALLTPNLSLLYRLPSADAYENLMPRRQARLLSLLGSDRASMGEKLSELKLLPEQKARLFVERKPILDILGVRYVLSAYPLETSEFRLLDEVKVTEHQIPVRIYENQSARPEVYLAKVVKPIQPDELTAFAALFDLSADETVLECRFCQISGTGSGTVNILNRGVDRLELVVEQEQENLLVFQQNHLPGWKAYLDGSETPIYTVNSVFMGVTVPAGSHQAVFEYKYSNLFKK